MNVFEGRCHCGAFHLVYSTAQEKDHVSARACDCSFCTRHGAFWSSDANGSLRIEGSGEDFGSYRFGTETADFIFCKRCASLLAALSEIDGKRYAVVNLAMLNPECGMRREAAAVSSLGDEESAARLARRARNWIPDVKLVLA